MIIEIKKKIEKTYTIANIKKKQPGKEIRHNDKCKTFWIH